MSLELLKSKFSTGSKPTGEDFASLIDTLGDTSTVDLVQENVEIVHENQTLLNDKIQILESNVHELKDKMTLLNNGETVEVDSAIEEIVQEISVIKSNIETMETFDTVEIKNDFNALIASFTALEQLVNGNVQFDASAITASLEALQLEVQAIKDMPALESYDDTEIKADIEGLKTDVENIKNMPVAESYDDTEIKADIEALELEVQAIKDAPVEGGVSYDDTVIRTSIETLEVDIENIKQALGNAQGDAQNSELSDKIIAIEGEILNIKSNIENILGTENVAYDDKELTARVVSLEESKVSLEESFETLNQLVQSIQDVEAYDDTEISAKVNVLEESVELIRTAVGAVLTYDDTQVKEDIRLLGEDLANVKDVVETLVNYDDTAINESVAELEAKVSKLESDLENIDLTGSNDDTITAIQEEINTIKQNIVGLAGSYDDAELQAKVTALESDVEELKNRAPVESGASYDDTEITGRVVTLESKVEALEEVDFSKDISDVNAKVTTLENTATATDNKIKTLETTVSEEKLKVTTLVADVQTLKMTSGTGAGGEVTVDLTEVNRDIAEQKVKVATLETDNANNKSDISVLKSFKDGASADIQSLKASRESMEATLDNVDLAIDYVEAELLSVESSVEDVELLVSGVEDRVVELENSAVTLRTDINKNKTDIASTNSNLTALNTSVTKNSTDLANTNVKVGLIESELATTGLSIDSIESDVENVKSTLQTVQTEIEKVEEDIETTVARVANAETATTLLEGSVQAINSNIASTASQISSISEDVTTLETTVAQNGLKIDGIETDLMTTEMSIDSIEMDVANVKSDVTTINTEISNLKVEDTTVKERVATLEGKATTLEDKVSLLESKDTSVDSSISAVSGRVSKLETDNTSNKDNISVIQTELEGLKNNGVDNAKVSAIETKLSMIEDGANKYIHPTGDGNLHVPATSTTNSGKVLTAGSTAGSLSWKTLDKASLGLGNVENTSDADKPISTATQEALDGVIAGIPKVTDSLESDSSVDSLSALQGNVLKELIEAHKSEIHVSEEEYNNLTQMLADWDGDKIGSDVKLVEKTESATPVIYTQKGVGVYLESHSAVSLGVSESLGSTFVAVTVVASKIITSTVTQLIFGADGKTYLRTGGRSIWNEPIQIGLDASHANEIATADKLGHVKVGEGLAIAEDGTLSATATNTGGGAVSEEEYNSLTQIINEWSDAGESLGYISSKAVPVEMIGTPMEYYNRGEGTYIERYKLTDENFNLKDDSITTSIFDSDVLVVTVIVSINAFYSATQYFFGLSGKVRQRVGTGFDNNWGDFTELGGFIKNELRVTTYINSSTPPTYKLKGTGIYSEVATPSKILLDETIFGASVNIVTLVASKSNTPTMNQLAIGKNGAMAIRSIAENDNSSWGNWVQIGLDASHANEIATADTLGHVKVGEGLAIAEDGTLSATASKIIGNALLETQAKTITEAINEVFTEVDNGKTLVGNAIIDKNVTLSNEPTFSEMATAIRNIQTGEGLSINTTSNKEIQLRLSENTYLIDPNRGDLVANIKKVEPSSLLMETPSYENDILERIEVSLDEVLDYSIMWNESNINFYLFVVNKFNRVVMYEYELINSVELMLIKASQVSVQSLERKYVGVKCFKNKRKVAFVSDRGAEYYNISEDGEFSSDRFYEVDNITVIDGINVGKQSQNGEYVYLNMDNDGTTNAVVLDSNMSECYLYDDVGETASYSIVATGGNYIVCKSIDVVVEGFEGQGYLTLYVWDYDYPVYLGKLSEIAMDYLGFEDSEPIVVTEYTSFENKDLYTLELFLKIGTIYGGNYGGIKITKENYNEEEYYDNELPIVESNYHYDYTSFKTSFVTNNKIICLENSFDLIEVARDGEKSYPQTDLYGLKDANSVIQINLYENSAFVGISISDNANPTVFLSDIDGEISRLESSLFQYGNLLPLKSSKRDVKYKITEHLVLAIQENGYQYLYDRNTMSMQESNFKVDGKPLEIIGSHSNNVFYLVYSNRVILYRVGVGFSDIKGVTVDVNYPIIGTGLFDGIWRSGGSYKYLALVNQKAIDIYLISKDDYTLSKSQTISDFGGEIAHVFKEVYYNGFAQSLNLIRTDRKPFCVYQMDKDDTFTTINPTEDITLSVSGDYNLHFVGVENLLIVEHENLRADFYSVVRRVSNTNINTYEFKKIALTENVGVKKMIQLSSSMLLVMTEGDTHLRYLGPFKYNLLREEDLKKFLLEAPIIIKDFGYENFENIIDGYDGYDGAYIIGENNQILFKTKDVSFTESYSYVNYNNISRYGKDNLKFLSVVTERSGDNVKLLKFD